MSKKNKGTSSSDGKKDVKASDRELETLRRRVQELEQAADAAEKEDRGITKRDVVQTAWVAPVVMAVNLPNSVFAQNMVSPVPLANTGRANTNACTNAKCTNTNAGTHTCHNAGTDAKCANTNAGTHARAHACPNACTDAKCANTNTGTNTGTRSDSPAWAIPALSSGTRNLINPEDRKSGIPGHPCRCSTAREFRVRDEIVIVSPRPVEDILDDGAKNRAVALNRSGRAIWELCDGQRSTDDIIRVLSKRFAADPEELAPQVTAALTKLSMQGFLDGIRNEPGTGTTFVIGIEDKPFFWWQTAIFLESLSGKLPEGWRTLVVVCNDGEPLSEELRNILDGYQTSYAEARNHAKSYRLDVGIGDGQFYSAANRVEALSVAAGLVDDGDMICLLDSDTFVYGDLNIEIMPTQCAAPRNWHIEQDRFFSTVDKNGGKGVDLRKILEAIGCDQDFEPGGVNVFVTGEVAKNRKFIADCFRFAHALYLLGRTAGAEVVWMAEMPCFTLAMTANGIRYELLEQKEFRVSDSSEKTIPFGTIYHYYNDLADSAHGAFRDSKWYKQAYRDENFLRSDFERFTAEATTDHERYFFELATNARQRLYV